MMKVRAIIAVILVLSFTVMLSGCGNSQTESKEKTQSKPKEMDPVKLFEEVVEATADPSSISCDFKVDLSIGEFTPQIEMGIESVLKPELSYHTMGTMLGIETEVIFTGGKEYVKIGETWTEATDAETAVATDELETELEAASIKNNLEKVKPYAKDGIVEEKEGYYQFELEANEELIAAIEEKSSGDLSPGTDVVGISDVSYEYKIDKETFLPMEQKMNMTIEIMDGSEVTENRQTVTAENIRYNDVEEIKAPI